MKKRFLAIFLCTVLLLAILPLTGAAGAAQGGTEAEMLDEIIVKFYDRSEFPGKEKQYDDEVAKVIKDGVSVVTDNVYVIRAEDLSKNPNAVLNRYKNSKFIEYVEPNYIMIADEAPNDPGYKTYTAAFTALNAVAGWDIANSGGPIVAVVDSGVAQNPDLPKLLTGYSAVSGLSPNNDKLGHGTGVAGTIGASGNNGLGTVGINWSANILPVKVDDAGGTMSTANVAKGIMWAADNGARIINLSLGSASDSVTMKNAIDYAYNKGCAIFAATGNESASTICYPARYPNVMAVGSTGNGTTRLASSNYGSGMGVVALSSYYTTTAAGGYAAMSGTSFATPQAAGLASLILAINPNLSNAEVYSYIQQGAKPLGGGYNEQTGYGLIDIGKTLKLVSDNAGPPKKDTTPPVLTLRGSASMELKQGTAFVEPGFTAIDDTDGDITSKVAVTGTVDVNVPGVYRIEYKVSDAAGNASSATRVVEVTAVDTTPPVLTLKGEQAMRLSQGDKFIEPGFTAIDNVDGDITYKVAVTGTVNTAAPGVYTLNYSVSDLAGNASSATRTVEVTAVEVVPEPKPELPTFSAPEGAKSLLSTAPTGTRNDYNGAVGYEIECLADITITHLGRPLNGAMNSTHRVSIWNTRSNLLVAYADITPDSPLDAAGFKVAALDAPVVLCKGELYRIVSAETNGGDSWYDVRDAQVMDLSGDFRFTTSVYSYEGGQSVYPSFTYDPDGVRGHVGATFYYTVNAEVITEPPPPPAPQYDTPPVLTLSGAVETSLFVDEVYAEAGYTATDCHGVNLTGAVKVTSNVNSWTPGVYTILYEVEDAGGNSVKATRTVIVAEREEPPRPANAPLLTIIGSDPIILHLDSGTPYTEQGATAIDEIDGDISGSVQITGSVDRNRAGTYSLSYQVTNSAGLSATATRTVRILSPSESRSPRQTYNFSGQGKAVSTDTHKNVVADDAGYMDFGVTSLDKNMTIVVEIKDQNTGAVVFSNTYTSVGGTQFWVDEGVYSVSVTISSANGNSKYGIKVITPEVIYMTFAEEEVPLAAPEWLKELISDGLTPLEICMKYQLTPDYLNPYYQDFIAVGWTEDDLAWFGLMDILEEAVPLGELPPTGPAANLPSMFFLIGTTLLGYGLVSLPGRKRKYEDE
ncbi:MAG: DUF5011 domain-containing protein [Oscillospiraceae bacterium]|nr:DUF5011 domain-containing protein [Oscillospiraceae bacterium]